MKHKMSSVTQNIVQKRNKVIYIVFYLMNENYDLLRSYPVIGKINYFEKYIA